MSVGAEQASAWAEWRTELGDGGWLQAHACVRRRGRAPERAAEQAVMMGHLREGKGKERRMVLGC